MIKLEKLNQNDFDTFKSWSKTESELFQFAGPIFHFPLTKEQLSNYITDQRREVYKVIYIETNEMIGNIELNLENELPRLSRIIIGNLNYRNKGLGKLITNKMLEKIFIENEYQKADLNVFDWNTQAVKCYEKVGFKTNPAIVNKQNNNGEIWTALNMTIDKTDWLRINYNEIHR